MRIRRQRSLHVWIDGEDGQALVELALVITLLILLLGGIVEFGRILQASLAVTHASREAARVGILGKTDEEIREAARRAAGTLDPAKLTISITPPENERKSGTELVVEVGYPVDIVIPVIPNILPDPFTVHGRTVMRME